MLSDSSTTVRLPPRLNLGQEHQTSVEHLLVNSRQSQKYASMWSDAERRRLFGFVIPAFQRPPVWTLQQKSAFVESLWLGLPVGHYVVNITGQYVDDKEHPTEGWLIDGQQRLLALESFFNNEFPLFGLYWQDFSVVERRKFLSIGYPHFQVAYTDESRLRDIYNRLSFGGTPHDESQRA